MLRGGGGNDASMVRPGNDTVSGDAGADLLSGGAGPDPTLSTTRMPPPRCLSTVDGVDNDGRGEGDNVVGRLRGRDRAASMTTPSSVARTTRLSSAATATTTSDGGGGADVLGGGAGADTAAYAECAVLRCS